MTANTKSFLGGGGGLKKRGLEKKKKASDQKGWAGGSGSGGTTGAGMGPQQGRGEIPRKISIPTLKNQGVNTKEEKEEGLSI